MDDLTTLELGAWIGKGQAFALLRKKCSAAQAECLKQIRERKLYEALGLSWEEFCPRHLGIHRSHADKLIQRLDEFGADYFRLSEIMRISPETYRAIEPAVRGQYIEIDGELVPITPENGPRIRAAVAALRSDLIQARELAPTCTDIVDLQCRLDACFAMIRKLLHHNSDRCTQASIRGLIQYSSTRLQQLAREP
jgi:hypothetical protein